MALWRSDGENGASCVWARLGEPRGLLFCVALSWMQKCKKADVCRGRDLSMGKSRVGKYAKV